MSTNNDMFGIVSRPAHEVWVHTTAGKGSGYVTCIRFATVLHVLGDAIEYKVDSVKGSEFWIKKSGLYQISYRDSYSAGTCNIGVTRNTTPEENGNETSTQIQSIATLSKIIAYGTASAAGVLARAECLVNLKQGDVIRAQDNVTTDGSNFFASNFRITYIDHF